MALAFSTPVPFPARHVDARSAFSRASLTFTSGPRRVRNGTTVRMSLADQMCDALAARYGRGGVPRVHQSVRDTVAGRALETDAGTPRHRRATSHVEGLASAPFWDVTELPWAARLEAAAEDITEELRNCSASRLATGTNVWAGPARPEATAYGPDWKTLVLQDREWDDVNCGIFAKTAALLRDEGPEAVPSVEAFFARQKPGTGIALHTDDCNFILTAHLGLDVPDNASWIEVAGERRYWNNGRLLIFDTSYFHRTMNESATQDRTVLLIRFWHPDLSPEERDALSFVFRAIEDPTLLMNPLEGTSGRVTAEQEGDVRPLHAASTPAKAVSREKRRAMRKSAKRSGSDLGRRGGGGGFG